MKRDIVDQKVSENKTDEMSAMFNMILDRKRQKQGKNEFLFTTITSLILISQFSRISHLS